jgi:hypothetical protein
VVWQSGQAGLRKAWYGRAKQGYYDIITPQTAWRGLARFCAAGRGTVEQGKANVALLYLK